MNTPATRLLPELNEFPASGECRFVWRTPENEVLWLSLLEQQAQVPVGYHPLHLAYQHDYFVNAFPCYRTLDVLIFWRDQAIGLWPLAIYGEAGALTVSSHINGARGIAPPLLATDATTKQQKRISSACLNALATLADQLDRTTSIWRFTSTAPWQNLGDWPAALLGHGATTSGQYRLIADLTLSADDYHQHLRKSYKSLINQAEKLWHVNIDANGDADQFAAFQALHEQVAGRKTRPVSTWQWQFAAITAGQAFAVYLHDQNGKLIGASLYNRSRDEAYYAVGAYDRSLFDQPVAHLSLYHAIAHARACGIQHFILGERPFPGDQAPPSAKELQIAFFKEGFATDLQLLPVLHLPFAGLAQAKLIP